MKFLSTAVGVATYHALSSAHVVVAESDYLKRKLGVQTIRKTHVIEFKNEEDHSGYWQKFQEDVDMHMSMPTGPPTTTAAPVTPAPVTPAPLTPVPTNAPIIAPSTPAPTDAPVTSAPVTPAPTDAPVSNPVPPAPTDAPVSNPVTPAPTDAPITAPVTPAPTDAPITSAPVTPAPTETPVAAPITPAPTDAPVTPAPTPAPVTPAPTDAPVTSAPVTSAPTPAPVTLAPNAAPVTPAPITPSPTDAPVTPSPTPAPVTPSPTPAPVTPAPTDAPVTPAPTDAPVTPAPTDAPVTPAPTDAPVTPAPTPAPVTPAPTDAPVTPAPTPAPVTPAPTPAPVTPAPTPSPTTAPVTPAPTPSPTTAPVTPAPTPSPTTAPVTPAPTPSPTPAPVTPAPTPSPTPAPVTPAPTPSPTPAPVTPAPTPSPTPAPVTPAPTPAPTLDTDLRELENNLGAGAYPTCAGDCDEDNDCSEANGRCFERNADDNTADLRVPGCTGTATTEVDYCFNADGFLWDVADVVGGVLVPFAPKDSDLVNTKLLECQGECDDNDDNCSGSLRCFGRDSSDNTQNTPVPGCTSAYAGEGIEGMDYCYEPSGIGAYVFDDCNMFAVKDQGNLLTECQSDCDSDSECAAGLVCGRRNTGDPLPSPCTNAYADINVWEDVNFCCNPASADCVSGISQCVAGCESDDDCAGNLHCFLRDSSDGTQNTPVNSCPGLTFASGANVCVDPAGILLYIFDTGEMFFGKNQCRSLNQCEGDCDTDADCATGLICGQRGTDDPIPDGCTDPYNNLSVWESTDFCCNPSGGNCFSS